MRLHSFDNRRNYNTTTVNKAFYRPINDVGMTFGSIVNNFKLWLLNDLKHSIPIQHTYIANSFIGTNTFLYTEKMLLSIPKPNLTLQYAIDHALENDSYRHPSMLSWEAINVLKAGQFMESIIKAHDKDNGNVDVKIAFKSVKFNINAGIVCQSRYYADNYTHSWSVRRRDGGVYKSKFLVDFQIPDDIIEMLYNKFEISRKTHRPMLKWLNSHVTLPVFYGINTFNGKPKFFVKYRPSAIIKPSGLSNPTMLQQEGQLGSEIWVINRTFEMDVVVPTFFSLTGYTDREIPLTEKKDALEEPGIIELLSKEFISEYALQIEDKHAIHEYEIVLEDDDYVKLSNGHTVTNKIKVGESLFEEGTMILFHDWAKKKGLSNHDIFDFTVHVGEGMHNTYTRLGKGHTLAEACDRLNMSMKELDKYTKDNNILLGTNDKRLLTIDDLDIPAEDTEYDHYIKNTEDLWFIDIDPARGYTYRITIYLSMRLYNQFMIETKHMLEESISSDDMAHEYPQGKNISFHDPQDKY